MFRRIRRRRRDADGANRQAVNWIVTGALGSALAVVAGAFGAHALASRLSTEALGQWETAARYLMYGSLGLLVLGLGLQQSESVGRVLRLAPWALALGTMIFSVSVGGLALGGARWLGAVAPVGGSLMILGFVLFAWGMVRS